MTIKKAIIKFVSKQKSSKGKEVGYVYLPKEFIGSKVAIMPDEAFYELYNIRQRYKALCKFLSHDGQGKMFSIITKTWNPITGCNHMCKYCWARKLAESKLKNSARYREGFIPRLNKEEFKVKFKGGCVFVCDMGDLFGEFIPSEWIYMVLNHIRKFPNTFFLFLTKNPKRYFEFYDKFPDNVILGATIETNKDKGYENISNAPPPSSRIEAMKNLEWPMKFLSIEPILDFDDNFVNDIKEINPFLIYLGYDNYYCKLPEPPLHKTLNLIKKLEEKGFFVIRKTIRRAWYEERNESNK